MLALPHLAGTECVAILQHLGFRVHRRSGGLVTLRRGTAAVIVPESATIGPALVASLLRAASVDPLDFLHAAEERGPCPPESTSAVA